MADSTNDKSLSAPPLPGPERERYIHEHDCPRIWDFWKKYALGSKVCPSCLLCGHQRHDPDEWAIRHAELPDIYICKPCVDAARTPPSASGPSALSLAKRCRPAVAYYMRAQERATMSAALSPVGKEAAEKEAAWLGRLLDEIDAMLAVSPEGGASNA
jgi:hypothetical protein